MWVRFPPGVPEKKNPNLAGPNPGGVRIYCFVGNAVSGRRIRVRANPIRKFISEQPVKRVYFEKRIGFYLSVSVLTFRRFPFWRRGGKGLTKARRRGDFPGLGTITGGLWQKKRIGKARWSALFFGKREKKYKSIRERKGRMVKF